MPRGSFGTVCTAQHRTTGKVVAVKRIPRTMAPDLTFAEISWEVEVLKLAGEHRNVTQFHDIFEDDDYYYLTMELARGGELFDLLVEDGPPDEAHTAALMKSLSEAVAFVHFHGIIHGDIKPENVFLTNSSTGDVDWEGVRLGDFGSAVEMALGGGKALSGMQTRGTVAYNPPESLQRMLDGKDVVVTTMGDVWALGIVLFMLLTGEHPFTPDMSISDEDMAQRVLEVCGDRAGNEFEAALFTDKGEDEEGGGDGAGGRSSVPPLARNLIMRMLNPNPERRATPQEILEHPWLERATLGIGDRTLRTLNPRGHRHRHRRNRHPRYGAPAPTDPEALQKFWSARRRLKAIMLSLMSGLVTVENEHYDEKEHLQALIGHRLGMERLKKKRAEAAAKEPPPPSPPLQPPQAGLAAAGLPAELLPGSLFELPPTRKVRRRDERKKEEERATAAAAAVEEEEEVKAKAAAEVAAAMIEASQDEADCERADRFFAMLADPSVNIRPFAVGSREAACSMIDRGQKGYITPGDLKHITLAMGERLTRAEITDMMRAIDGDPATESRRIAYGEMVEAVPPLGPTTKIKAGQTLYTQEQLDPNFYLLMKGSVEFSVSSALGTAGLQRQLPGASFGEVELLRPGELSTPRLATCVCVGQPSGGDCEVLVVTEHMFDLLTDTFKGVRAGLGLQREIRLTQLAEAVLTKVFEGEEASFGERDVVWGQNGKETAGDWIKVVPVQGPLRPLWCRKPPPAPVPPVSRPSRPRPPTPSSSLPSSGDSSSSSSGSAEALGKASGESRPAAGGAGEGEEPEMVSGDGGGSVTSPASRVVNLGARSVRSSGKRPALASRGSAIVSPAASGAAAAAAAATTAAAAAAERVPEGEAGGDASDAAQPASGLAAAAAAVSTAVDPEAAASSSEVDSEGSYVLLVLEGSITAEYGSDEEKERQARELADGSSAVTSLGKPMRTSSPRVTKDRVLTKRDFLFCGKGFGDADPVSPKVVSCKPGQTAKVLRIRAKDFALGMAERNMVSLKEFMFEK